MSIMSTMEEIGDARGATTPAEHKWTEIGMLPADWGLSQLGELTECIGRGITPNGGERVYKREGRPFLRSQNVGWGELRLDDLAFIDERTHAAFPATEIQNNDVLLNCTGASIGRCAVADERVATGNVNQHVCEIRCNRKRLEPHFLKSFLLSASGRRQIDSSGTSSKRQGLNFRQIRALKIPCPKSSEQEAISGALSDFDALISALDALIHKKCAIQLAAMQQLLTGRLRLANFQVQSVGFKAASAGSIPEDWQVFKIGEIGSVKTGPFGAALHERDYVDDGTPIITAEHLGEFGLLHAGITVSAVDRQRLEAYALQEGDIVIGKFGSLNRSMLVRQAEAGWLFSSGLLRIRPNREVANPSFLSYNFRQESFKARIRSVAVGRARASLSTQLMSDVDVILPGLAEQQSIAQILSDMDEEILALLRRRRKTNAIKQAMMQALLTGRIRLVKPESGV